MRGSLLGWELAMKFSWKPQKLERELHYWCSGKERNSCWPKEQGQRIP